MKVRNGFVSNSSSSSFVIYSKEELSSETLQKALGVPKNHPLHGFVSKITDLFESNSKPFDVEELKENFEKYECNYSKNILEKIEEGYSAYRCSFHNDGEGMELALYYSEISVDTDDLIIKSEYD